MPYDLRRLAPHLLAAVLAGCALAGCVGPTLTPDGYRHKVLDSAKTVAAAAASATYAARLELGGRLAFAVADTVVSGAEQDAGDAQQALDSRQPPDAASMALGERARAPIREVVDGLRQLRIALRRGEDAGMRRALGALARPVDDLQAMVGS